MKRHELLVGERKKKGHKKNDRKRGFTELAECGLDL